MAITIYSVKGCLRCKIVKKLLQDNGQTYRDCDALGEGRETFKKFYQNNRKKIHRGPDGVEFPIICDDEIVRQGLPMVVAHLFAGPALDGFFKSGQLHGEWIDGIYASGGDPAHGEQFLEVLYYFKKQKLKLQIETNGVNAHVLAQVLEQGLADRVVMEVKGPLELYEALIEQPVDPEEIKKSIVLVSQCDDYYFYSSISPIIRKKGELEHIRYISPEEIAGAANLIQTVTGDNKQPYRLMAFDPKAAENKRLQECEVLAKNELFKYKAKARKHQFKTETVAAHGFSGSGFRG